RSRISSAPSHSITRTAPSRGRIPISNRSAQTTSSVQPSTHPRRAVPTAAARSGREPRDNLVLGPKDQGLTEDKMPDTHIVVLAAGKGTRMLSARPKVLHRVAGLPMIDHVLASAAALQTKTTTVVVNSQAELLKAALPGHPGLTFVVQEPQRGTAHALLMAEPALRGQTGTLVLLSGDVPMLTPETLKRLLDHHTATGAAATVLTARVDRPRGYGRIVRSGEQIARIVEKRDASPVERDIREINSGIYAF